MSIIQQSSHFSFFEIYFLLVFSCFFRIYFGYFNFLTQLCQLSCISQSQFQCDLQQKNIRPYMIYILKLKVILFYPCQLFDQIYYQIILIRKSSMLQLSKSVPKKRGISLSNTPNCSGVNYPRDHSLSSIGNTQKNTQRIIYWEEVPNIPFINRKDQRNNYQVNYKPKVTFSYSQISQNQSNHFKQENLALDKKIGELQRQIQTKNITLDQIKRNQINTASRYQQTRRQNIQVFHDKNIHQKPKNSICNVEQFKEQLHMIKPFVVEREDQFLKEEKREQIKEVKTQLTLTKNKIYEDTNNIEILKRQSLPLTQKKTTLNTKKELVAPQKASPQKNSVKYSKDLHQKQNIMKQRKAIDPQRLRLMESKLLEIIRVCQNGL